MNPIRIMIVEDDPEWSKLLMMFLNAEPDLMVVGVATDQEQAIRLYKQLQTEVVLIDIMLGDDQYGGIYTAAEIRAQFDPKIFMLTSLTDEQAVVHAFAAGAAQYVPKQHYGDIPGIIRSLQRNFSPLNLLLKEFHRLKIEEQLQVLTPSERHIYELIEQGHALTQIGRMLVKSHSTVKNQVNNILKKLGAKNSKEAIANVMRKGVHHIPNKKSAGY